MRLCVFGASSDNIPQDYVRAVERLGQRMAQRGHGMVFGGGSHGLMGAAARGVHACGGEITGVAPEFFDKPGVLWKESGTLIITADMSQRKDRMEELSDGYIVVPGGLGTFDELFQEYTLCALGQQTKPLAVFDPGGFFDELYDFLRKACRMGFMTQRALECAPVFRDPDALLDYMESKKINR